MWRAYAMLTVALTVLPRLCIAAESLTWTIDGDVRHAIVYLPDAMGPRGAQPSGKPPLLLAFHGFGDDADNFQHVNLHRAWPEAVVAYFQGLPTRGNWPGWQTMRGQYGDRDLKLVDEAVASLQKRFDTDPKRTFATGFSNGAGFTYLLWSERPSVFAAFAPVAGRLADSVMPSVRKPLLHVAGRLDGTVRFVDHFPDHEHAATVLSVAVQDLFDLREFPRAIELGRRLFRSGENEYLLNRQKIRLRDLVDLLDEANLADNAFLFIGQGMVDQALALRPEERRPLFEEAAGIRKHERRRRAAEAEQIGRAHV